MGGGGGSGGGLLMLLPRPGSHGPGLTQPSRLLGGREAPGVQGGEVGRLSRRSWGESTEGGQALVLGSSSPGLREGLRLLCPPDSGKYCLQ